MKSKRYTTEQKIRILRDAERADISIVDVCRQKGISEQTFHRWKRQFGMMPLDQAKRLKELEKENARLKRFLADEILGKELLKEALGKSCEPRHKRQIPCEMTYTNPNVFLGVPGAPEYEKTVVDPERIRTLRLAVNL